MRAVREGVSHVWDAAGSNMRSRCGAVEVIASLLTIEPAGLCRVCPTPEPGELMPIRQHCACGSSFALMRVIFERGWLVEDESRCAKCGTVLWHHKKGTTTKTNPSVVGANVGSPAQVPTPARAGQARFEFE